jgi:hypothetical protein
MLSVLRRIGVASLASSGMAALLVASTASDTAAQYPSARLVPKGVLRLSFEPFYMNARDRFDASGMVEPIGTDFSDSAAGIRLFPTLEGAQLAVRSIVNDPNYTINAGAWTTTLDADIRRFPFDFHFGLTDWLTITTRLPIVTTRMQVSFVVDSSTANVGWNQIATQAGNSAALAELQSLFSQLEAGAQYVEGQIASGGYDCPSGPVCDQAQDVVDRTRALKLDLTLLSGADETGVVNPALPPLNPVATTTEAQAIVAEIASISSDLQALGATAVTADYPFPAVGDVGSEGMNAILGDSAFGYAAEPLDFIKYRNKLGDAEIGLKIGLAQKTNLRAIASATVRLPTGSLDSPDHYVDLGTGDKQTDVEFGLEGYWQAGSFLALAANASYNMQFGSSLVRRATTHEAPLAPLYTRTTVNRKLGNELRAGLFPSILLSHSFTVYGSVLYYHKPADSYTSDATDSGSPADPTTLGYQTKMTTWSFGAGIYYHAARNRSGPTLPIEAGIDYRAALQGKGGQTPKSVGVNFYLRLFWRWFGGADETPPVEQQEPQQ